MKKTCYLFVVLLSLFSCSSDDDGFSVPEKGDHEFVDLGLSVYWATCNVGADSPIGYGDYFAWGETSPKQNYTMVTYTFEENMDNISGTRYDAARVNWGGGWRMPTKDEMQELLDKCKKDGCTFTGPNGKSIYLPKAGMMDGSKGDGVGNNFYYWTADYHQMLDNNVVRDSYLSGHLDCESYLGMPIRPVKTK